MEIIESYTESGKLLNGNKIHIVNGDIYLDPIKLYIGKKMIKEDMLIWCSNIECILVHFEYVCRIFKTIE